MGEKLKKGVGFLLRKSSAEHPNGRTEPEPNSSAGSAQKVRPNLAVRLGTTPLDSLLKKQARKLE